MTILQRLFMKVVPNHVARDIEMESRAWVMLCPHCEAETSLWEAGVLRYKGRGRQQTLRRCHACGKRDWHRVYRKAEVPVPQVRDADWPDV